MPPHGHGGHHGGHHGGGRGYGYPYPIYDTSPVLLVNDSSQWVCSAKPPAVPMPGMYRRADGLYCWPVSGVGDDASPVATPVTNQIINIAGLGLVGYVIYRLFSGPSRGRR